MMDWINAHQFLVFGLIFMVVLGPAVGNYACSVVYRMPRGKTPFERHPFCGHCNADLKPIDLFPIWSWLSTRGKCRYCAGPVPGVYTVIEAVCGAVFIAYFIRFGVSEQFILYTSYAVFAVMVAAIQWQQGWIPATVYSYAITFVALLRTMQEHTIYGVIQSAFLMMMLAVIVSRIPKKTRDITPFEKPWIWWLVLIAALLPVDQWRLLVPVLVMPLLAPKQVRVMVYAATALFMPMIL